MEANIKITFYCKKDNFFCTYDDIPVLFEVSTGRPVIWVKSSNLIEEFNKELKRMFFKKIGMIVTPIPDDYIHYQTAFAEQKLKEFLVSIG